MKKHLEYVGTDGRIKLSRLRATIDGVLNWRLDLLTTYRCRNYK
jgi:hypothetical protein